MKINAHIMSYGHSIRPRISDRAFYIESIELRIVATEAVFVSSPTRWHARRRGHNSRRVGLVTPDGQLSR